MPYRPTAPPQASFNKFKSLPEELADLPNLELLRVACCELGQCPVGMREAHKHPRLAWFSGKSGAAWLRRRAAMLPAWVGTPAGRWSAESWSRGAWFPSCQPMELPTPDPVLLQWRATPAAPSGRHGPACPQSSSPTWRSAGNWVRPAHLLPARSPHHCPGMMAEPMLCGRDLECFWPGLRAASTMTLGWSNTCGQAAWARDTSGLYGRLPPLTHRPCIPRRWPCWLLHRRRRQRGGV